MLHNLIDGTAILEGTKTDLTVNELAGGQKTSGGSASWAKEQWQNLYPSIIRCPHVCFLLLTLLTGQISQPELPEAVGAVLGIVEEDWESKASLVKAASSDDPQLL